MPLAPSLDHLAGSSLHRWLLDADPSIRWQVGAHLLDAAADRIAAERARVAVEGWGARLLALQQQDGHWGGGPWVRNSWASTMETLMLLRELGLDPTSPESVRAVDLVRERCDWGAEWDHSPFFDGEVEPCINGRVLACGAYFGVPSERLAGRLLGEQLADGGWNCDAPPSSRSSLNTTLCVLEGLLEYECARSGDAAVRDARLRGQAYLLERQLCRRRSTGEPIERDRRSGAGMRQFAFPNRWHYDVLWALDYLRRAEVAADDSTVEAVALVAGKQQADGRWLLDDRHAGVVHFELEGDPGSSSRWITLRALRVLRWFAPEGR